MPGLRVIAGKAKGRRLRSVPGKGTRPVRDSVKEALFNILAPRVRGADFLDLFAGTGSVGIEALSRGARSCLFLDTSQLAVKTIRANLEHTGLGEGAQVRQANAFRYLLSRTGESFDLIYVAPPQYEEMWREALEEIDRHPELLKREGWVVVQIDPKEYFEIDLGNLEEFDRRRYGSTLLVFFRLPPLPPSKANFNG